MTPTQTKMISTPADSFNLVSVRLVKEQPRNYATRIIDDDQKAYELLNDLYSIGSLAEENVYLIMLNQQLAVVGVQVVSHGTVTASLVHPREVFKAAILTNATSIILAHNHPSGSLMVSAPDREVTGRIKAAGELLGIPMLSHLVVTGDGYVNA